MSLAQIHYDELPYTFSAMPYAHPDRLATLATLFGMQPPAVSSCRVLELGCGDGSHLIPIAYNLPETTCWGVDLSPQHIAKGQNTIDNMALSNIALKSMDIRAIDDAFGQFDYIIAHGIYSWVSAEVQDKILHICKQHLTPQGVAYISYNTKPGWHIRNTLRDMMRYHASTLKDPATRTQQLSTLLHLMTEAATEGKEPYHAFLQEELNLIGNLPPQFLFNELLAEENHPIYFHEFMTKAKAQGLDYLSDAFLFTLLPQHFFPQTVKNKSFFQEDLIHQEQYLDFLRNRDFRHTLLCHQGTPLERSLAPTLVERFYLASSLRPTTEATEKTQRFTNEQGTLSTDKLLVQTALRYLNQQWPQTVTFDQLLAQVQQSTKTTVAEAERHMLTSVLLKSYTMGLVELYSHPPHFTTTLSEQPQTSQLAQWQVQSRSQITNQRYEMVTVQDALTARLLPCLDGQQDRQALLKQLDIWLQEGVFNIELTSEKTGESIALSTEDKQEILEKILEDTLHRLAKMALLIA